jgi:dihydropteroate synthase
MTAVSNWRCGDRALPLGDRTLVMGIVNVTPDSFSDGGSLPDAAAGVEHARRLVAEGADLLDIGGESTRPGADEVSVDEELDRVVPVIEGLEADGIALSVDTRKAAVARAALEAGACIVNDVTAGSDPEMFPTVREFWAGLVLMHAQGDPKTMQLDPHYHDVVGEVRAFLVQRAAAAQDAGIERDRLCVDPGIGFGKNLQHNLALLRDIDTFAELGLPVLVGASRKRFIGTLTGVDEPGDRVDGSVAAAVWCASRGVQAVRVHDVRQTVRALHVVDAVVRGSS